MVETTSMVLIRAIRVHNYGNGIVGIEIPSVPMSEEDRQTLHRLFPMLTDGAYDLLNREALLASLFHGPLPESITHDIIECGTNQARNKPMKKSKSVDRYKEEGVENWPSETAPIPDSY